MYKKISEAFYFQNSDIFDRSAFVDAYMGHFHKEIDDHLRYAILEKAEGKNYQYLEFLMQRLLVLTQDDFKAIHDSGDGMQKISDYLKIIIQNAPINTEDMVLEQIAQLEKETSEYFTKSVLAIISALPYGISLKDLEAVLKEEHITYNTLSLTMLNYRDFTVFNKLIYLFVANAKHFADVLNSNNIREVFEDNFIYLYSRSIIHIIQPPRYD